VTPRPRKRIMNERVTLWDVCIAFASEDMRQCLSVHESSSAVMWCPSKGNQAGRAELELEARLCFRSFDGSLQLRSALPCLLQFPCVIFLINENRLQSQNCTGSGAQVVYGMCEAGTGDRRGAGPLSPSNRACMLKLIRVTRVLSHRLR
jgi:hypothetical protein